MLADAGANVGKPRGGCNSFEGDTVVATPEGETEIDTLQVGDSVLAYDSETGQTQTEPIQKVFINQDDNLMDVTLTKDSDTKPENADVPNKAQEVAVLSHGTRAGPPDPQNLTETIHTTTEHPFLTTDRGFVDAVKLVPGEHVIMLDGSVGTVVAVTVTPGIGIRYNLSVKDLHTFAVGQGQWVVHNTNCGQDLVDIAKKSR
jgi:hypothetical protein